jgi:hypothetical protein
MLLHITCLVLVTFVLIPQKAHAYIDPSSGSLLWQMLLAGAVGALFYARSFLARVWATVLKLGSTQGKHSPKR